MCKRLVFVLCAGALLFSSCNDIKEKDIFKYPVSVIDMPEVTGNLSPELVSYSEYPSSSFHMLGDSLMFAYTYKPPMEYFYSFISIDTADTLAQVCRKGRGPGEMLMPGVYFDTDGNYAHIVDLMNSSYYKLDLKESIAQKTSVYDRITKLDSESGASFSQSRIISQDKLICFNSQVSMKDYNLDGTPYFSVFDLKEGHHIKDYHCFDKIPLKQSASMNTLVQVALASHSTANAATERLCFMNVLSPQINFLDNITGEINGIRLGRKMRLSLKKPYSCFTAVCSDEERIYALFYGVEKDEMPVTNSKLLILDWTGDIQGFYQLDGPYFTFDITNDYFYLARGDQPYKLYKLPIGSIAM